MDREGDNFDLFAKFASHDVCFIIRLVHNRNLVDESEKLKQVVSRSAALLQRKVRITPRPLQLPGDQKNHQTRAAREATLTVSGSTVRLRRSNNFAPESPRELSVNVVTVTERDCPVGDQPIAWYLVTNEPVETAEQVSAVVDAYRARWVVEEYFKALKTGCQFEKRQLESYQSLRTALAIFLPIAVRLLALRGAARAEPNATCGSLSAKQIDVLRACGIKPLCTTPTNQQAFVALAALGGHLRSNGPLGWLVLGRGYDRLLILEQGWTAGEKGRDPIDD